MSVDFDIVLSSFPQLLGAAGLTLQLVAFAFAIGLVLSVPVALARMARNPLLWMPAYGYIFFFRGTPLLVQIFLIYFGSGQFVELWESIGLWGILREPYWCALIAFSLNTAAYMAELLRGGVQAIPHGEIEACMAMGMSRPLMLRRILLPRALRLMLPAYGNEIILLLKATSLASTITLLDLMGVARLIAARTYAPIEVFVAAGVLYLAIALFITWVFKLIEWRYTRFLHLAR